LSKQKKRLTIRRQSDTNGHWFDIAVGDSVDARLKPWRSISQRAFTIFLLAALAAFAIIGWQLAIQIESEINPRKLAQSLEPAVYEIYCGESSGTAFAVDLDILSGYQTTFVSASHIFRDCKVGDRLEMRGRDGLYSVVLEARSTALFYEISPDLNGDIALLGGQFQSQSLGVALEISRGDWAIAMGYPWGQEQYLSFGVVADQNATEVFVDTPLNEGNSGGPVVNGKGQVVGVVSYYPTFRNIYPGNEEGVFDRADGIAVLKKLSNVCSLPSNVVLVCPFTN
jgi:hypothetical protein